MYGNGLLEFWGVLWFFNGANKRLVLHVQFGCGSLSITTPVPLQAIVLYPASPTLSLLLVHKETRGTRLLQANELDNRSVLQGQVSLTVVY